MNVPLNGGISFIFLRKSKGPWKILSWGADAVTESESDADANTDAIDYDAGADAHPCR